jgi:hypothetical protein
MVEPHSHAAKRGSTGRVVKPALGWVLFVVLLAHVAAHVLLAVGLNKQTSWRRAVVAFVLPPLAPLWGWRAGMRRPVYVWAATLVAYAIGVAIA